jgi:cytochrome c
MTPNRLAILAIALAISACRDESTSDDFDEALYARGEIVFQRLCSTCHEERERWNKVGPSLAGLMGRRAGSVSGYEYSAAMREFDIEWDEDALVAFLVDPTITVPDTKMVIEPVDDPDERAALIYYLKQQ